MRRRKSYIGANLTHDASVCQVTDGKIDWFIEEERFSKVKHDKHPFKSLMESDLYKDLDNKIQVSGLYEPHNKQELIDNSKFFTALCQKKYSSTIAAGPHEDIEYEYYLQSFKLIYTHLFVNRSRKSKYISNDTMKIQRMTKVRTQNLNTSSINFSGHTPQPNLHPVIA